MKLLNTKSIIDCNESDEILHLLENKNIFNDIYDL